MSARGPGLWSTARSVAESAPASRNRYVDFLRAASICVVVLGHWLVTMPAVIDGEWRMADAMRVIPWLQWLTWVFQVMPLFFIVGGYSNAVSWQSAQRKGLTYGHWASARLQRLVGPLLPLLVFWVLVAIVAKQLGMGPELLRNASRAALVPVWFLAVYILVTIATPWTYELFRRWGAGSVIVAALVAGAVDFVSFGQALPGLRWANYAFVWLAVHQVGYLWQARRLAKRRHVLMLGLIGLASLILLVTVAGYPVSMLTVPGEEVSNSRPPTFALLALGLFHAGLLLTMESPARRWLDKLGPWTVTVLVNSRIMTLYLWHLTVMLISIGIAYSVGSIGLTFAAGSSAWWLSRLPWIVVLLTVMLLFVAILGRFEHARAQRSRADLSGWRVIAGSTLLCIGLALLVTRGISDEGLIGLRWAGVLPTLAGLLFVRGRWPFARE